MGTARRFSVDIDIVTSTIPAQVQVALRNLCQRPPFLRYAYDERRSTKYYVYFEPALTLQRPAPYIAFDVVYENYGYPQLLQVPVQSDFLQLDGAPQRLMVPSVEAIAGDKLTAFAPLWTG